MWSVEPAVQCAGERCVGNEGPLDNINRAILQILQRDARHATVVNITKRIEVSDGTVPHSQPGSDSQPLR